MEEVLEVDTRPGDPGCPQVGLDQTSRLLGEVNPPRSPACGPLARQEDEDERGGVGNLLVVCEPLRGWRSVRVSARRTRSEGAHCRQGAGRGLLPPDAEQVVLVHANPNTHTPAWLEAAFAPAKARRLPPTGWELHSTPGRGAG